MPTSRHHYRYCGIGSRSTPHPVLRKMSELSRALADGGWVLRTGGAEGADRAFYAPLVELPVQVPMWEVYLPWPGFNGLHSRTSPLGVFDQPSPIAYSIAAAHHPLWSTLSSGVRALHARNVHQVLGPLCDAREASKFVMCWTPDGTEQHTTERTGGTGQAIRVATSYGVPVVNMNCFGWDERLRALLETYR